MDSDEQARQLLREGAAAELRLLRAEQKAERRLLSAVSASARDAARLRKAAERFARSQAAVTEAEAVLLDRQNRRTAGPPPFSG